MKFQPTIAALCAAAFFSGGVFAMTSAEQKTEKTRIEAEHKAASDQCKPMKGNAKDVCNKQADGQKKIAMADVKHRAEPTEGHRHDLAKAKADAEYDVAKEKCDDATGNTKDVCQKEAKATHVKALEAAKVAEVSAKPSSNPSDVADARKDAADKTREADYKAAKERCDAMAGDAKDACVTDAKRKFGQ